MTSSSAVSASRMSSPSLPAPKASAGTILKAALIGGAIAAAANLALYVIGRAIGVPFVAKFDPNAPAGTLALPFVAMASLVPALAAGVFFIVLQKLVRPAPKVFLAVAVVFTLLSFGGPIGLAEASAGTKAVLALMHVVAGIAIGGSILRSARSALTS